MNAYDMNPSAYSRFVVPLLVLLALVLPGQAQVSAPPSSPPPTVVPLPALDPFNPPPQDFPGWPQPVGTRQISTAVTLRRVQGSYIMPAETPVVLNLLPGSELKLTPDDANDVADAPAAYVWKKDSTTLSQTSRTLVLASVSAADSGAYAVPGFETVTVRVEEPNRQRLLNLSTRATISAQQPFFITGFVVSSDPAASAQPKSVLLRVVGPTLAGQGVADPLAKPAVRIFRADGTEVQALNDNTPGGARARLGLLAARLGAFPLPNDSADAVKYLLLPSGVYSAHVYSADGGTGTVLLELYEVSPEDAWSLGIGLAN